MLAEAPHSKRGILVLGLGNPIRRDDGVGLEVLHRAQAALEELGGPGGPVICRGLCAGGFDLMYEVVGYDRLVVVDSLYTPTSVAGRVGVVTSDQLTCGDAGTVSPHLLGLPEALLWSARVGYHTPRLEAAVVVEVDGRCMEFGEGLSEPVRAAIPEAVRTLCRIVGDVASNRAPLGQTMELGT